MSGIGQQRAEFHYSFPTRITLSEVRAAIVGRREFKETRAEGLVFIKYTQASKTTFPHPIHGTSPEEQRQFALLRECRGLVFHERSGVPVARRFHKFFNLNELDESLASNVDWNEENILVLEKLDGSLVSPVPILPNSENVNIQDVQDIRWATIGGFSDTSKRTESFIQKSSAQYNDLSRVALNQGFTPLFEWRSPKDRIVMPVSDDSLVLIAMRNIDTGEYMSFVEMKTLAERFNVPFVEPICGINGETVPELIRQRTDIEGVVLRFSDGRMYKCKTEFYVNTNLIGKRINSPHTVWRAILQGSMDDVLAANLLGKEHRAILLEFKDEMEASIQKIAGQLEMVVAEYQTQRDQHSSIDAFLTHFWQHKYPEHRDENVKQHRLQLYSDYLNSKKGEKTELEAVGEYIQRFVENWKTFKKEESSLRRLLSLKKPLTVPKSKKSLHPFKSFNRKSVNKVKRYPLDSQDAAPVLTSLQETYANKIPETNDLVINDTEKGQYIVHAFCRDKIQVLIKHKIPMFFRLEHTPFLPTLKALVQHPTLLPRMQVDKGAIRFILSGAVIMCPGLTSPGGKITPNVDKEKFVAVYAQGEDEAIAVGKMLMSSDEIQSKNSGGAIQTLHIKNDGLYQVKKL